MAPSTLPLTVIGALVQPRAFAQPWVGAGAAGSRGAWSTPSLLVGDCSTAWTSSSEKYKMPYRVHFGRAGRYEWWAPYRIGSATEVGKGMILSPPVRTERTDGSWEAHWFAANSFVPTPDNSTNCCCEYVGGKGPGHPRILADYCVGSVPNSLNRPMQEVCAPFIQACPANNATALQMMGKPFVEYYSTCSAGVLVEPWAQAVALAATMAALGLVAASLRIARCKPTGEAEPDDYHVLAAEDGAAPGSGQQVAAAALASQEAAQQKARALDSEPVPSKLDYTGALMRQETETSTVAPDFPWSRVTSVAASSAPDWSESLFVPSRQGSEALI